MALLLILSVIIPVSITGMTPDPTLAAVSNCTINTPTGAPPVYTHVNGTIPINFTIGIAGDETETYVATFALLQSGSVIYNLPILPISAPGTGLYTATYLAQVPLGVANGTYDLQMGAYQSTGGGSATTVPSSIISSCVVINSTHVPATPSGLLPASGTCSSSNTPTFSWTAVTETSYTFTYNFWLSASSSFSTTENLTTGLTSPSITMATALADGTHYWKVQAQDQYGNTGSWSSASSICIDTATPTLPSGLPTGSTTGYYNPTYSWTVSSDTASCANIRYWVQTSSDAFSTLADNATNIIGNSYTVSSILPAGTYRWRVQAYDCAGNASGWVTIGATFAIVSAPTTASIHMGPGWNLISLPMCPSSQQSITPLAFMGLCDNQSAIQIIWGYNASSSAFQYYIPNTTGNSLTAIDVTKGYWIQTSSPVNVNISGSSCPVAPNSNVTGTLYSGWNLVGYKSGSAVLATSYFPLLIHSNISFICGYSGGWNCNAPASITLEPGKGYWVYYGGTSSGSYGLPCY